MRSARGDVVVRMSMTGFGKSQQMAHGFDVSVEMRSLNHRFLEISPRVPRGYGFLEEPLKQLVQSRVSRGKVEVTLTLNPTSENAMRVTCNRTLVEGYLSSLREIGGELGLVDDLTLASVAQLEGVLSTAQPPHDEEQITEDVLGVAGDALAGLVSMRAFEGERLTADLKGKLTEMDQVVAQIAMESPQSVVHYKQRLTARMQELLKQTNIEIDPLRLLTEVAIFAERTAIDEELVRLNSHLAQFRKMLDAPEAVGRKLDFMIQELGREVNCIGSKSSDVTVTELVVEGKAVLEKMREQLQNLE